MGEADKALNYRQVMERLGVSRSTVYALIQSGALRAYNVALKKGIRVRESEVERFKYDRELAILDIRSNYTD
jgi:excisionase family DNA binding protein